MSWVCIHVGDPCWPELLGEKPGRTLLLPGFPGPFIEVPNGPPDYLHLGFFDWIRRSDGGLIGVRITFHDGRDEAKGLAADRLRGASREDDILEFLFETDAVVDWAQSVDQDIDYCAMFTDVLGNLLLVVDGSLLGHDDFSAIRQLDDGRRSRNV